MSFGASSALSDGPVYGLFQSLMTQTIKAFSSTVFAQIAGFSLALGMVVHGLSVCGHGKAEDVQPHLLASWMKILLMEVSGAEPEDSACELANDQCPDLCLSGLSHHASTSCCQRPGSFGWIRG